jgi:elongation factor Ts
MDITAKMVQELRERSGAPLMECKRALAATSGDVEQAFDHLRKAGLKTADKKAGAATSEGRVRLQIAPDGKSGAILLLTSQTDFAAKTDDFTKMVDRLARHAAQMKPPSAEAMLAQCFDGSKSTIGDTIRELVGKIGENMQLAKVVVLETARGRVGGYLHHDQKQGALIALSTGAPAAKVDEFLKFLGQHIVAKSPVALSREEIPADVIEREKSVYRESDDLKGKPVDRHAKILAGKLEKFFASSALLEQPWVRDEGQSVLKVMAQELGPDTRIEGFALVRAGA